MSTLPEPLRKKVEAALALHTGGHATVGALDRLIGGAMQENYRVEAVLESGPLAGARRFAIRADPTHHVMGSLPRRQELEVIRAAVGAGVKTPEARWLTPRLFREGADAYFVDWILGEAIGRRVVRNPELQSARDALPAALGEQLAKVHSITPTAAPQLPLQQVPEEGPARSMLAVFRTAADAMAEVHPALEVVLRWLEDHAPGDREVVLCHGDFRTGNFMVTPEGLSGILDWEFAHWGAPLEDVAWISVRDWRFGQLNQPIGGFGQRAPFYEAYERASGRSIDRRQLHWWEVCGNVRWAIGSVIQGERYLSGQESDLELLAIPVRAVEMEYEALRLIDRSV